MDAISLDKYKSQVYIIECAKQIKTRYGESFVLLLDDKSTYFSNPCINVVIDNLIKEDRLTKWGCRNTLIHYNVDLTPFLKIKRGS